MIVLRADRYTFLSNLAHFFLEWEMFQIKCVENIKTHILCSVTLFQKSCRLWDNVENIVERGRTQIKVRRSRVGCWIRKATNTLSEYVILSVFHCNSGYANVPQYYVIRSLTILLVSPGMIGDVTIQIRHPRKYLKYVNQMQGKQDQWLCCL